MASYLTQPAIAQSYLKSSEVAVSAFGQFTGSSNGNDIEVNPLDSIGGQATFRHVYSPRLGYEAGYGYTRFSDRYSSYPFRIQHNVHEFGGSYLISLSRFLGMQPFGLAGVSALLYAPTLNGGQNASAQARAAFTFGLGGDFPLITSHFGLRVQYRGLLHQTPDYGDPRFDSGTWRVSNEPAVGMFWHF